MRAGRKIAILLHERDGYPEVKVHFIWALCDLWRAAGIEIEVLKGPGNAGAADLLIPHIDLTVLPEAYVDIFKRYPHVANRHVRDISKRIISRNLVGANDAYDGAVIVKTNLNFGGMPEAQLAGKPPPQKRKRAWWGRACGGEKFLEPDWAKLQCLNPSDYQIFPSLKQVPRAIFTNPSLVMERFLPEFDNELYHLRIYQFFGSRGYCVRLGSREPIVKTQSVVSREEIAIPEEIVALRSELGLDYGKMDFVVREGRVILFDVNRTPGLILPSERMQVSAARLAPGVEAFLS